MKYLLIILILFVNGFVSAQIMQSTEQIRKEMARIRQTTNWDDPAAAKKAKPSELHEQRVSFVYGSLDSKSNITREHIRQVIDEREELAA